MKRNPYLLALTLLVLLPCAAHAQAWYNSSWLYRKAITIDYTKVNSGPHTNFTVLINRADASLQARAQADGDDILFTSADGTTKLDHEIEKYTSASGTLVAWVEIPSLSSSANTVIFMYYGNAAAASQQNRIGTWDANYKGVYHLNSTFVDATSNANNGTNAGTVAVAGKAANGASFVRSNGTDFITITGLMGSPANITLSGWATLTTADINGSEIISLGDHVAMRYDDNTGQTYGFFYAGSNVFQTTTSNTNYAGTGWHYVVYTFDDVANSQAIYIDGVQLGSSTQAISIDYAGLGANTYIGKHGNASASFDFDGTIDEVRVASASRSAGWILTEYNNQNSPATFYSVGTEAKTYYSRATGNASAATTWSTTGHTGSAATTTPGNAIGDYAIIGNSNTVTVDGNLTTQVEIVVNSTGVLNMGTSTVGGAGSFIVNSGGTLGIGSAVGITTSGATGNVQVTGARTFATGANYIYNGALAQVTGNALPATVNNLTINNSAGVSLTGAVDVGGALTLTSGKLTTSTNSLYLKSTGTVSRTSGYVAGNFRKYVATGVTSKTFEIGDAAGYTPVTAAFASVTVAGDLTAGTTAGDHPNIGTANISSAKGVNRYWTLVNGGITFTTCSATFTFVAGDIDAGAATGSFNIGRYSASAWTNPTVGTRTGTTTQATGLTSFGAFQIGETAALSISGRVFEDVNYGGGSGRNWTTASANGGVGRSGARVELFDAGGNYVSAATTDASGNFAFSSLNSANWFVRAVSGSVTSSRTGYTSSCLPVQTFRTNGSSGTASAVTDNVGGQDPSTADAGNAASGWILNTSTGGFTGSGSGKAHSFSATTITGSSITGVDFGYGFDVVVNKNNAGQGSLRQMLTNANALANTGLAQSGLTAGKDNAVFMLADGTARPGMNTGYATQFTSGVATVALASTYPTVTDPVILDATRQPGFAATPIIELNGAGAGAGVTGLAITAGGSTVRGLIINRFTADGIGLSAGGSNTIAGNYIGTNAAGTAASANATVGIRIGSSGNTIGGSTAAARNIISGNGSYGIDMTGGTNVVLGNYVGTNAAGTAAVANGVTGINLHNGANGNTIGGTATGAGNVISGNLAAGLAIDASTGNSVLGNYVGINAAGNAVLANGNIGVYLFNGANSNTIGGATAGAANTVSGNLYGVAISGSSGASVVGNYIGTNPTGTGALPNNLGIYLLNGASGNTIGGTTPAARNIVSGNSSHGFYLDSAGGNIIQGNYIGVNAAGTAGLANAVTGITMQRRSNNNTIGGTASGAGNVISGNTTYGISIDSISGTSVAGNYIGTNAAGAGAIANGSGIMIINGATGNTIGGTAAGSRNLISGNGTSGIAIGNTATTNNFVQGNYIGTNATGTAALANGLVGVYILTGAHDNTIGGTTAAARNVISGNALYGVAIHQPNTNGNVVQGNYIGVDVAGTGALPNGSMGIYVLQQANNSMIGGTASGAGNVISGNTSYGITIDSASGTSILGNIIGTNAAGTAPVGNAVAGVQVLNGLGGNAIGGIAARASNTISGNGKGVVIVGGAGNAITSNSIYGNTGLGIDLANDGVTINNGTKSGALPNAGMDMPVFAAASLNGNTVSLSGHVGSAAGQSTFGGATVQIFKSDNDAGGYGEGQTLLGTLTADAAGNFSGGLTANGLAVADMITATATDAGGNTSEFAANIALDRRVVSTATGGNWSSTTTWVGGVVPGADDVVDIVSSATVGLDGNIVRDAGDTLTVYGVLNCGAYTVSGAGEFTLAPGATLGIGSTGGISSTGATGNIQGTGARAFSIAASYTYNGTAAQVTGNGLPATVGNLTVANTTSAVTAGANCAVTGNLTITSGTFNLGTYTVDRATAGGTLALSNAATLNIGATSSFPANYTAVAISSASTVEYSGTNQTVANQTYGTLKLSSSSGAAVKTMPATAFAVTNLTSTLGSGSSVSFTAASDIMIGGAVTIGASTTFNGGSYAHTLGGNWTNNGTFVGGASTVTMSGFNAAIAGTGTTTFYNLTITGIDVTAASSTSFTVSGNLTSTGAGKFIHSPGGAGSITMSGSGKSIGGTGLTLNNLIVTGTIGTAATTAIAGNMTVNGSLTASAGTITMSGTSKTIGGTGTLSLSELAVPGSISTAMSFRLTEDLAVVGTLTATAGTVTFGGTSTLSGAANLFNVVLNGTKLQLATGADMGVAGVLTLTAGTFDVWTSTPNTVVYNGPGSQTVMATRYSGLTLSGAGTKTAAGAIRIDEDLTIDSGAAFDAAGYTHSLYQDWVNNGTFIAGTSTVELIGGSDAEMRGATTFNNLTIDGNSSTVTVTMASDMTVANLAVTAGSLRTGSNKVIITSARTGDGIILGTITRTHAFAANTAYAFEGPNNTVKFDIGAANVTSVTVTVTPGSIPDFPYGTAINRSYYNNTVTASGPYSATLRLHYEDAELAGNTESALDLWHYVGGAWATAGRTGSDSVSNWTELTGLADLEGRWTLAPASAGVVMWTGVAGTTWNTAGNWTVVAGTASRPPAAGDVVLLGNTIASNQPTITSAVTVKGISFRSVQASSLTLGSGGSLAVQGNVEGTWSGSVTHTIAVGAQAATIGGSLILSDGTSGHAIDLTIGAGSASVAGSITEDGGADITFTGAGSLNVGGNFIHASGTFTPGTGTVVYDGSSAQTTAEGITYHNLTFNKASGTAALTAPVQANGDLTVSTGGTLFVDSTLTVAGNVTIGSGATFIVEAVETHGALVVGGGLVNSGTFNSSSGTIVLNGTGAQSIPAGITIGNLVIDKASGTATLAGTVIINSELSVIAGTLDLVTYTANRSALGGMLTLDSGTTLLVAGTNGFPSNYASTAIASASTVQYNGTVSQTIGPAPYGNLTLANGAGNAKSLGGSIGVAGNLLINSGATFNGDSNTVELSGNWTNSGTFIASNSHVTLSGTARTLSGMTTFSNLAVRGTYTATSDITINDALTITGALATGNTSVVLSGDFINTGSFTNGGTVTFTGTKVQRLVLNAYVSTGSTYFNGTVATIPGSGTVIPHFQDLYVYNTGTRVEAATTGILCFGNLVIGPGVVADAGNGSSAFFGSVTNYGRVVGSGTASFLPSGAATINLEAGDSAEYINTGKIIFGGSGPLTFVGTMPVFNDVDIVNTNAAGVTPNLGWTINGTLTIAAGRTFHAGAGLVHTVVGEVITNGTFDGGTSTMVLGSPSGTNVTGSSRPTFYNLTIAGRVRLAADIAISRDFTNNGDFTSNGYQVEFIGSEPSVITGTASPTPIRDFHIEKVGSTVTAGVDIGDVHHLDMMSGTFDLGTHAIASGITADTLTMLAGTTLRFGGTSSLPSFPVNVIDASSTVEYYGSGSQTITATRYGSLLSSSTGARILDPSGPIYVEGAFTPGSNSYTVSGSTMVFANDGDNADDSVQAIPAFNYYNLTGADESPHILDPTGVIGIAGTFTPGANTYAVAGSTVDFNGGSQTIPSMTFDNVRFTSSGTKTAAGALTATGDLTIGSGTTLNGGSFTHVVQGNWTTNGTFAPATSTVRLTGADPATIAGVTAFNACEVTKADAATTVTLGSDVTAATVNVNVGRILTGANTIEITSARTGNGIILGTIKHTHPFVANTAYAFEGPNNLLTFTNSGTLPTSVTVTVATASPGATASMDTIGRYYRIAQSGGSGYHYALRLHYDDNEIAAPNTEGTLKMWLRTTTSPDIWTRLGTTAGDTVNNWVAYSGLNSVGTFSLSSHSYPEMALALLQDVDVAAPADEVIYTVNYHNVGDGSAGDAIVTVSAPTHTSYVPGSVTLDAAGKTDAIDSDEVSVNGSTITVNLSAVPAGASGTITYRVRVE